MNNNKKSNLYLQLKSKMWKPKQFFLEIEVKSGDKFL